MTVRVLSLSAGVNSTALLVLKSRGWADFDLAIFADTGGEQPETYWYIEEVIKPFCEKNQIELVIVKREGDPLYEDSLKRKIIPTRIWRSCSDKFKIRAIRRYLLKRFPNENIITLIGFCKGEEKRQKNSECQSVAPLIDLGIDREACIEIIQDAGLPIPVKSGCFFCPFQPFASWLSLLKNHPDLYQKAEILEQNGQRYPELVLPFEYSLKTIRESIQNQKSMYSFLVKQPLCSMCELENNEVLA